MLVEKRRHTIESFRFEPAGRSIPVTFGYETYGQLSAAKDNVILVCHYFTGTSHAAGRYAAEDPAPGWWDALIGAGKAIDTDRFLVICADVVSNINYHNPAVITTGPASPNPATGKPYGLDFPIFTIQDMVRMQKDLLESLGISRLHAVIGPSMGGLQAFAWGRLYPDLVGRIGSVVATPMMRPSCLMVPNQLAIDAIRLDPNWCGGDYYGRTEPREGLLLAFKVLLTATRTDHWSHANFGRRFFAPEGGPFLSPYESFDGRFLVEHEIESTVLSRMEFFDANSYLYIAKANTLFDLAENGESFAEALGRLNMPVLMVIDESDLMFTREQAEEARPLLPDGRVEYYDSRNGHLSCLFETGYFAETLRGFVTG